MSRRTEEERERLRCGFWVHFSDNQLCGGGEDIRITAVKQYLTKPLQPELTVGDEVKRVSVAQKLTQIESHVSATYNYVKTVEERTQQGLQLVEDTQSEIIEPSEDVENYKGRINVTDLLAIPVAEIGANDLYLVYSDGSKEDGWSEGQTFTIDGETCDDGTFFQFINGYWEKVGKEVDLSNYLRFNELPKQVSFIQSVFRATSYDDLYGEGARGGMLIARIGNYELDENGVYQPIFAEKGTQGQQYYCKNYTKTLYVPYARRYLQGGEFHYDGGVVTAADYQRLMEGIDKKDVFVATYGETTFDELVDAYEEGKMIIVKQEPIIAVLGYFYVNEFHFFAVDRYDNTNNARIYEFRMNFTNGWSGSSFTSENMGDRVSSTEMSENLLTDNKYLSALSVKTLIEEYIAELATVANSGDYNDLINKPTIPSAVTDVVKYTAQSLTDAQKTQARQNIGAGETLIFDATPTANSNNPVTSNGIKTALDNKQNTLTLDSTPTANSTNPVTSGGMKTALDEKSDVGHTHTTSDITDFPTIPTDVVKYVPQSLSSAEKEQACTNIGAAKASVLQEVILAMNGKANTSLSNLDSNTAGGNIANALTGYYVQQLLDKLAKDTTSVDEAHAYVVMSNQNGLGYKQSWESFQTQILGVYAKRKYATFMYKTANGVTEIDANGISWVVGTSSVLENMYLYVDGVETEAEMIDFLASYRISVQVAFGEQDGDWQVGREDAATINMKMRSNSAGATARATLTISLEHSSWGYAIEHDGVYATVCCDRIMP